MVSSTPDAGADAGVTQCGTLVAPSVTASCHSCTAGSGTCQANGCYGGWWCDTSTNRCKVAPTTCDPSDAGVRDAGLPDAGAPFDAGLRDAGSNHVGVDGGVVDHLYFAVIGDTRPALIDDTANYPTAIITSVYQTLEALPSRPLFAVSTGDYMFARPSGNEGAVQLQQYVAARNHFSGVLFPAVGNHECTGATASNCATTSTNNLVAYRNALLAPLGQPKLYYSFNVNDAAQRWSAKFIISACNAWDSAQSAWLAAELARPTTYTFVIRHEPLGVAAPCTTQMDALLQQHPPTMMLVGHTHTFSHSGTQLVEGVGGAPISGNAVYGFATIEQVSGGFQVKQYEAGTARVVASYLVP